MEEKALIKLLQDMLEYKRREARFLFIALIAVICMNLITVAGFLYYESQMETTTTTTTTTKTEQQIQGDDGNIVNGDQYNDKAQKRSD